MGKIVVKWRIYEKNGNVRLPKHVSKTYSNDGYKFYENIQYRLAKLNKAEYMFFHFICEKMDESNNIVHTKHLRQEFIAHATKNLCLNYKDDTIKKAFAKLVKIGLIIRYDVKSDYTVNPRHVFKCSEKNRTDIIQTIISQLIMLKHTRSNFKDALGIK
jgi:hypothetical protein